MQRPDWDTYFMLQAEIAKLRSNCLTRHIGAVIVKDNRPSLPAIMEHRPGLRTAMRADVFAVLPELRVRLSPVKALIAPFVHSR